MQSPCVCCVEWDVVLSSLLFVNVLVAVMDACLCQDHRLNICVMLS
jgi:hypothetical protein